MPNWLPLARIRAVHELSREEGSASSVGRHRQEDGIRDRNALPAREAIALSRTIRAKAISRIVPDSTPLIRADRDGR